jgi:hypothetical protein
MTMLIFTAPLARQFRFVSIVTILQQTAPAFVENEATWIAADATDAKRPRGSDGLTACQRVGQTLALFLYLHRGLN